MTDQALVVLLYQWWMRPKVYHFWVSHKRWNGPWGFTHLEKKESFDVLRWKHYSHVLQNVYDWRIGRNLGRKGYRSLRNPVNFCLRMEMICDTDLGKDLPFEGYVDFRMSSWWNRRLSETISSELPISPDIDSRLSPYKDKPSCDRLLKDTNNVETLFR